MIINTGTVTVTNGSKTVTGSGTKFLSNGVGIEDLLLVDGNTRVISSVDSETQLTLTTAYTGTSGSGKAYEVVHTAIDSGTVNTMNDLANQVSKLVNSYGGVKNAVTETASSGGIPKAKSNGKIDDAWIDFATQLASYLPLSGGNITGTLTIGSKDVDIIEEQGSNSNGEYVRYKNGLQICYKKVHEDNVDIVPGQLIAAATIYESPASFINTALHGFCAILGTCGAISVPSSETSSGGYKVAKALVQTGPSGCYLVNTGRTNQDFIYDPSQPLGDTHVKSFDAYFVYVGRWK